MSFKLDNGGAVTTFTHEPCGRSFAFLDGTYYDEIIEVLDGHEDKDCKPTTVNKDEFRITNASITHHPCGSTKAIGPTRTPREVINQLLETHVCGKETWDGKSAPKEDDEGGKEPTDTSWREITYPATLMGIEPSRTEMGVATFKPPRHADGGYGSHMRAYTPPRRTY